MSMKKQRMVKLQLAGRGLTDLDLFSKSDPFLRVSRRNPHNNTLTQVRRTETIDNNLNPDWSILYMSLQELCDADLNMKLQLDVLDDDGKTSQLIGGASLSLVELQEYCDRRKTIALYSKNKHRGDLHVILCSVDPPPLQERIPLSADGSEVDSVGYSGTLTFHPTFIGSSGFLAGSPDYPPTPMPGTLTYPPGPMVGTPTYSPGPMVGTTTYPPGPMLGTPTYPPSYLPGTPIYPPSSVTTSSPYSPFLYSSLPSAPDAALPYPVSSANLPASPSDKPYPPSGPWI